MKESWHKVTPPSLSNGEQIGNLVLNRFSRKQEERGRPEEEQRRRRRDAVEEEEKEDQSQKKTKPGQYNAAQLT